MVLGVIFSLLGIGVLIAVMLNMAIFALPLFVGVTAGRLAYQTSAGLVGAISIGLVASAAAFGLGQLALAVSRSTLLRLAVAVLFAGPAAFAGYHVVLGLSRIGGAHGLWQPIFAIVGATIIAGAALARLFTPIMPAAGAERMA